MSYAKLNLKELQNRLDAISEDAEDYAWINVETGDHGYGTKEEMSNWTHYIPMSDFSYFSGDEDYKGLDDETAQEQGWIKVDITEAFEKGINKMNKLDIKELQNRLEAISEDAGGKDIPVNKDIKLAGDSRYGKGKNPESVFVTKVEILPRGDEDGVAMADVEVEHDGPREIYTDSGFEAEISKIVGFKVEFTEAGMQQPGIASLEGLSKVSEHEIRTKHGAMYDGREEKFDQDMFDITHAISQVAKTLLPTMQAMDLQRPEYAAFEDAAKYYGLELDDEPEDINFAAYDNLDDSDMKKFMADYKEPPVVNPDVLQPDLFDDESVKEGEAELAELKSALGRTGGVMGFKN